MACGRRVVFAFVLLVAACARTLNERPDLYRMWDAPVAINGASLDVTFVKPAHPRHPRLLVLFASGDAGWRGASGEIVEHMAEEGYYLAAFDARQVVGQVKGAEAFPTIPQAAAAVETLIVSARAALVLDETVPIVVTGFSRGANFVVFTAAVQSLQRHVAGAVALALTRETDFLQAPPAGERPPELLVDAQGRIQTYPAIALAGAIPFAVIHPENDAYVEAEEARRLFGPDTPTRRLYEVPGANHGFNGRREVMLRDLDDALRWIEAERAGA